MITTAQTTTLPQDLTAALRNAGVNRYRSQKVAEVLPDAGQYELLQVLKAGTLDAFLAQWIENLGRALRTSTADAAYVLRLLTEGPTR